MTPSDQTLDDLASEARALRGIVKWFLIIIVPLVLGSSTFSCVALGAASDSTDAADSATAAVEEINRQRAEARVASCGRDNEAITRDNAKWGRVLDLIGGFGQESMAFVDLLRPLVTDPLRDCSPEGIDDYLSTTVPVTPATNSQPVPTDP